jgi:t-SNARE complex subunit (syntaxin)
MTISIEQDLKDVLNKIEQKFDKIEQKFDKIEQKFDKMDGKMDALSKDVTEVKISLAKLTEKAEATDKDVKELKNTQKAQIWSLIIIVLTAVLGLSTILVRSTFNVG